MLNLKEKLFIAEVIRVLATLIILYVVNIPIVLKIILIILFDTIDCAGGSKFFTWVNCNGITYQRSDKITDIICYSILLFYILNNGGLSPTSNGILILLFLYRFIGTCIFLIKNNRKYLFYFPNFFLEICLGLIVINNYPILKNYKNTIIIAIVLYKFLLEYYLHIYKYNKYNKYNKSTAI